MAGEAHTPPGSFTSPSSTPIRSSPLTRPPVLATGRTASPARRLSDHVSHTNHRPIIPTHRHVSQPISTSPHRRKSHGHGTSHHSTVAVPQSSSQTSSPPLSRSQPLLGSYQLSLLHSRMSRTQSHSVHGNSQSGFSLYIGAVGKGKSVSPELRCPPPMTIPFVATYYDLPTSAGGGNGGNGAASQTPWVGHVDLEQRYFDEYAAYQSPGAGSSKGAMADPPSFPGMRVAPLGQLQLVIKSTSAPVKVFVIPYDVRTLPVGGRLLVRERTMVQTATEYDSSGRSGSSGQKRELLRYAIQLQFTAIADEPTSESDGASTTRARAIAHSLPLDLHHHHRSRPQHVDSQHLSIYLSRSIKVIFSAQPPEKGEVCRTERHDEGVSPSRSPVRADTHRSGAEQDQHTHVQHNHSQRRKGSVSDRRDEWEMVRQKWIARKQMEQQGLSSDPDPDSIPSVFDFEEEEDDGTEADAEAEAEDRSRQHPLRGTVEGKTVYFEKSPIPKHHILPHIPLLAPIAGSAGPSTVPSRSSTPSAGVPILGQQPYSTLAAASGSGPGPAALVSKESHGRTASPTPAITQQQQQPQQHGHGGLKSPTAQRSGRRRRPGSGSYEDKELSEKLRALGLKNEWA